MSVPMAHSNRATFWAAFVLAAGLFLGSIGNASAHLVNTGLGPVYDGVSHFMLSPETVLACIAVALLGALNGTAAARASVLFGMAGWIVGSVAGLIFRWSPNVMICTEIPLLLGLAVAFGWKLSASTSRWIAAGAGLVLGLASGAALAQPGPGVRGILGSFVPCFVLLSVIAAVALGAKQQWARTIVRVVGSWITAMSLLMIGWLWKMGG